MSAERPRTPDAANIREAVAQYEAPLVRYATHILHDVERARDVVQDAFLRLVRTEHPPHERQLKQWLFAVCRNRAIDVLRKETRMSMLPEGQAVRMPDPQDGPLRTAERRETGETARRLLGELPQRQQEILRLKFQEGFSYRQIASITGLSASNVGFLIHKSLERMRRRMQRPPRPDVRRA